MYTNIAKILPLQCLNAYDLVQSLLTFLTDVYLKFLDINISLYISVNLLLKYQCFLRLLSRKLCQWTTATLCLILDEIFLVKRNSKFTHNEPINLYHFLVIRQEQCNLRKNFWYYFLGKTSWFYISKFYISMEREDIV